VTPGPVEDPIDEAHRLAEAAKSKKLGLKLLGGAGINLHSPSARKAPLKRKYGDLDYAMSKRDRRALDFFADLGCERMWMEEERGRPINQERVREAAERRKARS
jgi:hypothetical protein